MGSSPFTATIPPSPARLLDNLRRDLARKTTTGDLLLVAFSGGPDSTALLWALQRIVRDLEVGLHATHLDHRLDADSTRRARAAGRLAAALRVPLTLETLDPGSPDRWSTGHEAWAREHRYRFLQRQADRLGARWIVTAHHADDQAETVLLRLLFGSGLEGLGAMRRERGQVLRPLLRLRRTEVESLVTASGLTPVLDPTNDDLTIPRNAVRRRLLPYLEESQPGATQRCCRLASAARRAAAKIEDVLEPQLDLGPVLDRATGEPVGAALDRKTFTALPAPLHPFALALLHRRAGAAYPAAATARRELLRQLQAGSAVGCDCGSGWRWEGDAETLSLVQVASSAGDFAYTLCAPGSVDIPELGLRMHLQRGSVAPWMFRGRPRKAGLAGIDLGERQILVRNRRAGDRIRPLGSRSRRLKDLLIDRRIPKRERDRLPLLVIDDEIAWVPGVTINDHFRIADEPSVWIATIESRALTAPPSEDLQPD